MLDAGQARFTRARGGGLRATNIAVVLVLGLLALPPSVFAGVDLTLSITSVSPSSVTSGASITIGYRIANGGSSQAGSSGIKLWISSNTTLEESSDTYLSPSVPIGTMPSGGAAAGTVTRTVPSTLSAGTWYVIGKADPFDKVAETNENNNVSTAKSFSIAPPPCPGAFANSSPSNGAQLASGTTSATLSWSSSSNATQYKVYFPTGNLLQKTVTGTSTTVSVSDGGSYSWRVVAENSCGQKESSSGVWSLSVATCPSLGAFTYIYPSNAYAVDPPGAAMTLIWNKSSGASSYDVYFGTSSSPGLHKNVVSSSCSSADCRLAVTSTYGNTYHWKVVAKSACRTLTSSSGIWSFTQPPQPTKDLWPAIAATPDKLYAGESLTITTTTRNEGTVAVGATTTKMYLSVNTVVDSSDILLYSISVPGLSGKSNSTDLRSVTIPTTTPSGNWYLIAQADSSNSVPDESNESNNTGTYPVEVTPRPGPPDLAATALSVSPSAGVTGSTPVTVSGRIANIGGSSTGTFTWELTHNGSVVDSGTNNLGPTGALSENIISWTGRLPKGTHDFVLSADPANAVGESTALRANNSRSLRVVSEPRYGTTVITHGYQPVAQYAPYWTYSLAEAIGRRLGTYRILFYNKETGTLDVTGFLSLGFDIFGGDVTKGPTGMAGGETIVIFDWATESDRDVLGYSEAAADALFAALMNAEAHGQLNLDNIHLIGHSRGTVVNSELAERLLSIGRAVGQMTTLDPHDLGLRVVGTDTHISHDLDVNNAERHPSYPALPDGSGRRRGVVCWNGITRCDNYYQDAWGRLKQWRGFIPLDGMVIAGAHNVHLSPTADRKTDMNHSLVHTWYQLTAVEFPGADEDGDGSAEYPKSTWSNWFPDDDAKNLPCYDNRRDTGKALSEGYSGSVRIGDPACSETSGVPTDAEFNWATEGIINGDFERPDVGPVPGWSDHVLAPPSYAGAVVHVGNNHVLQLLSSPYSMGRIRRHSRLWIPTDATAVVFRYAVIRPDARNPLTVTFSGASSTIPINAHTWSTSQPWSTGVISIPEAVRGTVVGDLTFSLNSIYSDGGGTEVYVDDVGFVLSGLLPPADLAATSEAGRVLLRWSDRSSFESGVVIERRDAGGSWSHISSVPADHVTYTDTGVNGCTAYEYRVHAIQGGNRSGYSNIAPVTTGGCTTSPDSPTQITATVLSNTSVRIQWADNSNNETGFFIESRNASGGAWTAATTVDAGVISVDLGALTACSTYLFRVSAFNSQGPSAASPEVTATTGGCPIAPVTPARVVANGVSASSIDVSWSDVSDSETGFIVEIRNSPSDAWRESGRTLAGATSLSVHGLSACTSYYFRVKSYNSAGPSTPSSETMASTLGCTSRPNAPTGVLVVAASSGGVQITWNSTSAEVTAFKVHRRISAGAWEQIASAEPNSSSCFDPTVSPCTSVSYFVIASSQAGDSSPSAEATVMTAGCATVTSPPSNVLATAAGGAVTIRWSGTDGASEYEIYRSHGGAAFTLHAKVPASSTFFTDSSCPTNTTCLYKVRALGAAGITSEFSNIDVATMVTFTDDPVVPRASAIRSVHLLQLRNAVNAVRAAAGLDPAAFTDASLLGVSVTSLHVQELRSALSAALSRLGITVNYSNAVLAGRVIAAADINELRVAVK